MDKADWRAFGEWVESLRKGAGLQVRELAARADVSVQWLQEIRGGGRGVYGTWRLPNPKDEALARLARALNVAPGEMLARAGRDASSSDVAEARSHQGLSTEETESSATARMRELEDRVAQHERDLAEVRRLLEKETRRQTNTG